MMKLMIGIPSGESGRHAVFYDYVDMLEIPKNTLKKTVRGQSPARGRNTIIKAALENNCTHILFLDDDLALPNNLFTELVKHDKDMVTGLYLMRNYPHRPIIFDVAKKDGACAWHYLDNKETGLIEIVAAGLGCCLIKTDVFRKMEPTVTKNSQGQPNWITLGELEKDHWCDDISFFIRARELGYKLFCDLNVQCGHLATVTVLPKHIDGQWRTLYANNGEGNPVIPKAEISVSELTDREKYYESLVEA